MQPAVYILANHRYGTLYVCVTSSLPYRTWQHRSGAVEGFSKRFGLKMLVWYELHQAITSAIQREKQIKAWRRDWKIKLIERANPTWQDLYENFNH
ncbi:MAG: GIY-YIG nuclease family protein [Parvibaculaceae bacterium]